MKVLFVNYEFPPVGGGAARASLATARELVAMGHRVDFLTIDTTDAHAPEEIDGVRVHAVRAYRRGQHEASMAGSVSFLLRAARLLPRLARDESYDVAHYYFGLPTGLLTFVPGLQRSRPYIVSLRGSDVPGYDPKLTMYHRVLRPVTGRILGNAYRVVANSEALRGLALAAFPQERIDVIHNGVELLPAAGPLPVANGRGLRLLTVSRLIMRKGLDDLIRALAKLGRADVSLDIAGDGPARSQLGQLARELGVAGQVRFLGFTDHADLTRLYRQADLFVLSSRSESCSMALLEAMAAGLPIIATSVGGTPELVRHDSTGLLVRPDNVDDLAGAIGALLGDPARRTRLGAAGLSKANRDHSWRSVARRYEAVLYEAIGRDRADKPAARPEHPGQAADRKRR